MPSQTPVRALRSVARPSRRCLCQKPAAWTARSFTTTRSVAADKEQADAEAPRWSQTPPQMKGPFPLRPKDPEKLFKVNEDPVLLDAVYVRFLGRGAETLLPDETKWLAVTHKSFDLGRRGFNDRLAYFGKRFVMTQAMLATLQVPPRSSKPWVDTHGREPVQDPALKALQNLNNLSLEQTLSVARIAKLAYDVGLGRVMRWQPRMVDDLNASGIDLVATSTVFAIIGAVALQHGGDMAAKLTRERILKPLGVYNDL